jgi:hypothetical protein
VHQRVAACSVATRNQGLHRLPRVFGRERDSPVLAGGREEPIAVPGLLMRGEQAVSLNGENSDLSEGHACSND